VLALGAAGRGRGLLAGLSLGAAAASKFYALILVPLLLRALGRRRGAVAVLAGAAVLAGSLLVAPGGGGRRERTLLEFALGWENHDAIFSWTRALCAALAPGGAVVVRVAGGVQRVPREHLLALAGASLALLVLALAAARPPGTEPAPAAVPRRAFHLLAAVFLLGPLGFPWYFVWCVPLLPFASLRAWCVLPGLLALYYLRFWFEYHHPGAFGGFAAGAEFFDTVVVSLEFGAFFILLAAEAVWRRLRPGRGPPG
jgi:hypothetical protein